MIGYKFFRKRKMRLAFLLITTVFLYHKIGTPFAYVRGVIQMLENENKAFTTSITNQHRNLPSTASLKVLKERPNTKAELFHESNIRDTNQPLCIEDNICKKSLKDDYYIYRRKPDFIKLIDGDINYDTNISHTDFVVPNIVHFIQYTDVTNNRSVNGFEFHHMLSVLSAYKFQKPERIYFWMDKEPESEYWLRLKKMVPMYLIIRERPTSIRGRKIHFITKISNIIRMEALIEYGGMYFDLDVLVVKSFDPLRKFDTTMGQQSGHNFCNAVLVGKPWSDFLRRWHQEHVTLNENIWSHHSGKVPYRLSLKYPTLIHVEEVSFFRPAFYEMDLLYKEGNLYNWRKLNYCVHLWIRLFKGRRRTTGEEIESWNTTVGEVYRYILHDDSRL